MGTEDHVLGRGAGRQAIPVPPEATLPLPLLPYGLYF